MTQWLRRLISYDDKGLNTVCFRLCFTLWSRKGHYNISGLYLFMSLDWSLCLIILIACIMSLPSPAGLAGCGTAGVESEAGGAASPLSPLCSSHSTLHTLLPYPEASLLAPPHPPHRRPPYLPPPPPPPAGRTPPETSVSALRCPQPQLPLCWLSEPGSPAAGSAVCSWAIKRIR